MSGPLKWIDYASPNSIKEAVSLLSSKNTASRAMAGGTDLIVQLRAAPERIGNPDLVVDIKNMIGKIVQGFMVWIIFENIQMF